MTKPLRKAIMTRLLGLKINIIKQNCLLIRICLKNKGTIVIGYTREK